MTLGHGNRLRRTIGIEEFFEIEDAEAQGPLFSASTTAEIQGHANGAYMKPNSALARLAESEPQYGDVFSTMSLDIRSCSEPYSRPRAGLRSRS